MVKPFCIVRIEPGSSVEFAVQCITLIPNILRIWVLVIKRVPPTPPPPSLPFRYTPSDTLHQIQSIRYTPSDTLHQILSIRYTPSDTLMRYTPPDTLKQIHSVRYTPSSSQIPSLWGAGLDDCTGVRSRRKVSPRLGRKHKSARSIVSNTLPKGGGARCLHGCPFAT